MRNKSWCDICEEEVEGKTTMVGDKYASIFICKRHKLAQNKAHLLNNYLYRRFGLEKSNEKFEQKNI